MGAGSTILASAEIYDPATGAFNATGAMAAPHAHHAASSLSDGSVLVTGGNDATQPAPNAELYNPAAGTFASTGPMHGTRSRHTSTWLDAGQVLIVGGLSLDGAFLCPELYTRLVCTQPPQVHFNVIGPVRVNTAAEVPLYVTDDEPLPEERLQCVAAGASGACTFGQLECMTLTGISIKFKAGPTPGVCNLHFVARDASGTLGVGFANVQVVP
jgi:hypothetical protein